MKKMILMVVLAFFSANLVNAQNDKTPNYRHVSEQNDEFFELGTEIIKGMRADRKLVFRNDGNLVYYREGKVEWHTNTQNKDAVYFRITTKGNLEVVGRGDVVIWSANSGNKDGWVLKLEEFKDSGFKLLTRDGKIAWEPTGLTIQYDNVEGCGTFFMDGKELKKHCGWRTTWHTVLMIGCTSGSTPEYKILFYDQSNGSAEIYKVDTNGNMVSLQAFTSFRNDWESITWEGPSACEGLIKFQLADGSWEKYSCDDSGNIALDSRSN